jgi:hypothetical protein
MNKPTNILLALLVLLIAVAIGFLAAPRLADPLPPELMMSRAAGDTNFTNVVAEGDVTAGDDLIATDDLSAVDATLTGSIITTIDNEHVGLPTVDSAAVAIATDGALWTVGTSEIWFVHAVYCRVTTNFDCTGDDCTLDIGTGADADGFLDLDDAELQAADTEGTGAPAGWQGFMSTDTRGAFFAAGQGFVIANDTIDIAVADTGGTNPSAGAATCYIIYTRIQ